MTSPDSDSENVRSVEKKVKGRKEKKKTEKVAGVLGHPETQPEIVEGSRKKKKAANPETPLESESAPPNPEGKEKKKKRKRDREDGEPLSSDDKEKKKRKKEKISDITGTVAVASEVGKEKKKRKKNKSSAEISDPPLSSAIGPTASVGAADEPKKPRKRKPVKDDSVDANGDGRPSSESKSKPKKRKKGEVVEDEGQQSAVAPTEDPSRKRKKSRKSVHPDPADDPDLTEQSQKALIYIYSQSASPGTWKFNKARQNWIIRNVWTSKVPEKYVPMVVGYLSKVQGQVRETLIESCNKAISGSNPKLSATQTGTDEQDSSEKLNLPASDVVRSERTQRAYTLLHALTKS